MLDYFWSLSRQSLSISTTSTSTIGLDWSRTHYKACILLRCHLTATVQSATGHQLSLSTASWFLSPFFHRTWVRYTSHVSGAVRSQDHTTRSIEQQKLSIGMSLWQQFTVAMILRVNMRQRFMNSNDAKLRDALARMRLGWSGPWLRLAGVRFLRTVTFFYSLPSLRSSHKRSVALRH